MATLRGFFSGLVQFTLSFIVLAVLVLGAMHFLQRFMLTDFMKGLTTLTF